ncbi:MAG: peptide deformylase [Alphaproteobacteria bacterium]|nr:peptide deformylase [Alphaproteobacteria bacterium]
MTKLRVLTAPDPILAAKAQPVTRVDDAVRRQMDDMLETMYDGGIGLAANQVGLLNRVIVMDMRGARWDLVAEGRGLYRVADVRHSDDGMENREPLVMANPEIMKISDEKSIYPEGCLSVPGQFCDVIRPAFVTVKYLDYDGKEQTMEADGLLSHCIQHEIDHLDGVLFVDHLSRLKRNMIVRKLEKLKKQEIL